VFWSYFLLYSFCVYFSTCLVNQSIDTIESGEVHFVLQTNIFYVRADQDWSSASQQRYGWTVLGVCFQFIYCNQWKYICTTASNISYQAHQITSHFSFGINGIKVFDSYDFISKGFICIYMKSVLDFDSCLEDMFVLLEAVDILRMNNFWTE
jgi:hypothetical protein